ncbi:unnamed protein product [Sphagnum troendelagicum]|uniref:Interferon-related developmental regulator N-terminal domain-containing protein n=1 Tax=Sphagnum troendelagicum TaxID=128251 RepID=A0ABP0TA65_9BRYO
MGKSRKQQQQRRGAGTRVDEYTDDDTLSTTTTSSSLDALSDISITPEIEEEHDDATKLESFIEALYQKRASIRDAGLKGLIEALTGGVLVEFTENNYETLLQRFINSVKIGASSEVAQAARALGLLAITVGAGDIAKQINAEASPHLEKVAKVGSSPAARASCLDAMAILAFVGATELEATESTMAVFWLIISHRANHFEDQKTGANTPSGTVKAAAISAWSLLLSTLDPKRVSSSQHVQMCLPVLSRLLKGDDLAVRTASGEAIALLYEVTNFLSTAGAADDDDDGDSEDTGAVKESVRTSSEKPASSKSAMSVVGKALEAQEAHVMEQMKSLSVHAGGKGQPRKERAMQRSAFRELLATIEDGVAPEVSVKLPAGNVLSLHTWSDIIQLNVLRHFLGEGFQRHMQENTLLHEIFDFVPQVEKNTLSKKQKRMFLSPNSVMSKARTQVMNRRRSYSQAGNIGIYDVTEEQDE